MAIIYSTIKNSPIGRWYIELSNDLDDEKEHCLDIFEYAKKIEEMAKKYDEVVEVVWSSDEDVTPEQINEVRMQINAYEYENSKNSEEMF